MELFSAIHEPEDRELYIETVHMKAEYVKSRFDLVAQKA
jgi:hypothetical protein